MQRNEKTRAGSRRSQSRTLDVCLLRRVQMRTYFTKRTGFRKVRNKKGIKFKWQEAQGTVGQSAVNYVRRRRSIFTRCDGYHWFEANSYRCDLFRPLIFTSFLDSQVTSCIATVDTRDLSVVQVREQIANYITREERLFNQFFVIFCSLILTLTRTNF